MISRLFKHLSSILLLSKKSKIEINSSQKVFSSFNKLIKGKVIFIDKGYFDCELTITLPSGIPITRIQTIFDTQHSHNQRYALTLRSFLERPYYELCWKVNGQDLTERIVYGTFAYINFGFDNSTSTMWLKCGEKQSIKFKPTNDKVFLLFLELPQIIRKIY